MSPIAASSPANTTSSSVATAMILHCCVLARTACFSTTSTSRRAFSRTSCPRTAPSVFRAHEWSSSSRT
uniref:Putative secreted protein n=1 Tax=Anopheles triannulatus TaxID=58253 RepID=A0A2M4B4G5_9DIPT